MSEFNVGLKEAYLRKVCSEVGEILENQFRIDINTKDKILDEYFTEGFLPKWYFYSNTPDTIAHHIYMMFQFLNANSDMVSQSSDNNRSKTYFVNVGRDYPGRLAGIIEENRDMKIFSMDSEWTASGLRVVTIDKRGDSYVSLTDEEKVRADELRQHILDYGKENKLKFQEEFLKTIPGKYIKEELTAQRYPDRIFRHLHLFESCLAKGKPVVESSIIQDTLRISMAVAHPEDRFLPQVLQFFKTSNINLKRTYFDQFEGEKNRVGIISVYIDPEGRNYKDLERELREVLTGLEPASRKSEAVDSMEHEIEALIRRVSAPVSGEHLDECLSELKSLCEENLKPGREIGNFYLNCVSDFLEAASITGLDKNPEILKGLLGFENFDEFFVSCGKSGRHHNVPGYRIKHSTVRGASKGGLRIDPIVNFGEVAALSFMMTWKCARSRILFGGAKGGLMLNPREYDPRSIDFFDSLSNFGRSLFLVTGPAKDVPAGDVGCGAEEIGRMFEGFKSALRDLALMVYGVKNNVTMIGDRIISIEEARTILEEGFDIDYTDLDILKELGTNQEYLELVVAAQITGKPRMGIDARTGATGRGMCYATLAAVANLYLEGKWESSAPLTSDEEAVLKDMAAVTADLILEKNGTDIVPDGNWKILRDSVFPKLLKDKKMVVQGSGKVGSSIMRELAIFGVNLIAVSDAGGAVIGDNLDPEELLGAVAGSRDAEDPRVRASVIHAEKNVTKRIKGAAEGSKILELECDLLFPAALENAVTEKNANRIKAKIEVCGSNGSNSSKAEKILQKRGVLVIYDFLANSAGVTASYFEWLRNLNQRCRFEAEQIHNQEFDDSVMDRYIMPEFLDRIKSILTQEESQETTDRWNRILRDIMFSAVNEDYRFAAEKGTSLKNAGFINSQMRVFAALLSGKDEDERRVLTESLPKETLTMLDSFLAHPELKNIRTAL